MRISDWSSDVCSSDLDTGCRGYILCLLEGNDIGVEAVGDPPHGGIILGRARLASRAVLLGEEFDVPARDLERALCGLGRCREDRKTAGWGNGVRVRVGLGVRAYLTKKININHP